MSHAGDVSRTIFLAALLVFVYAASFRKPLNSAALGCGLLCIGITAVLNVLSLLYFVLSIFCRGRVEYDLQTATLLKLCNTKRFCRRCNRFKPERAHHCSACGYCVKKMDHHCMWISNCVNYDNQGHFIRFLFFTALSSTVSFALAMVTVYRFVFKGYLIERMVDLCCLVLVAIASFILAIATGGFLCFHMTLVLRNTTFLEKLRLESVLSYEDASQASPYDRGLYINLKEALGSPCTLFLIGPLGDGIFFPKTYPAEHWPSTYEHCTIEEDAVV
jgi:hypothetical protein